MNILDLLALTPPARSTMFDEWFERATRSGNGIPPLRVYARANAAAGDADDLLFA